MSDDPFHNAQKMPVNTALAERIGYSFALVQAAVNEVDTARSSITTSWKFSKTSGWYVTYDRGKKRLFYLFPKKGDFLLRLVLNEQGMEALRAEGKLSATLEAQLAEPKKYPEGTLFELNKTTALKGTLLMLLRVKLAS
jgi:hypothetical protein